MANFEVGKYNFNKDLITGETGEEEVKEFFEKCGFRFIGKCNNNELDLIMEYNRRPITIEVKTDSYRDTGNMAIEIESRGKLSGLSVTTADYFTTIFRCTSELWIIRTEDLRTLISENNFYLKENGGDKGSNTKFYLIPRSKFRKHFQVYKLS